MPSLIDQWASGNPRQGGRAYGINILGCILGPLFASYFLLPWLREGHALLILSGPLFALYLLNLRALSGKRQAISGLAAAGVLIWSLFFAQDFQTLIRGFGKGMEARRDYAAS